MYTFIYIYIYIVHDMLLYSYPYFLWFLILYHMTYTLGITLLVLLDLFICMDLHPLSHMFFDNNRQHLFHHYSFSYISFSSFWENLFQPIDNFFLVYFSTRSLFGPPC